MLTINCLFLSRAHDRNKRKTHKLHEGLKGSAVFQPMLLNSKFLHKKGASPCAGKHSCTSSKMNVLKAFFDLTFY